jgi:hypothetical protein
MGKFVFGSTLPMSQCGLLGDDRPEQQCFGQRCEFFKYFFRIKKNDPVPGSGSWTFLWPLKNNMMSNTADCK